MTAIEDIYSGQAEKWVRPNDRMWHARDFLVTPWIIDQIKAYSADATVLVAGCGEGYESRLIAHLGLGVIGVDMSVGMLNLAIEKEKKDSLGIDYRLCSMEQLDVDDESIDIYTSILAIQCNPPTMMVDIFSEAYRVLRSGGKFFVGTLNPYHAYMHANGLEHGAPAWIEHIAKLGSVLQTEIKTLDGSILHVKDYNISDNQYCSAIESANLILETSQRNFTLREQAPSFAEIAAKQIYVAYVGRK